jgi:hypothetical protein
MEAEKALCKQEINVEILFGWLFMEGFNGMKKFENYCYDHKLETAHYVNPSPCNMHSRLPS